MKNSVRHAGIHGQVSGKHFQPQSSGRLTPLGTGTEVCNRLSPDTIGTRILSAPRQPFLKGEYCCVSFYAAVLEKKTLHREERWERRYLRP